MSEPITYKTAGVDIDEGDRFVDVISPLIKKTRRPEALSSVGGYGGLFGLDLTRYPEPVLVSTTDGVGTKLKLAFDLNRFDSIGIDLVAMCVNDLICCGAEPLFFLDYYATAKLEVAKARDVIAGMTDALAEINCTLLGGETAEMPGMYQPGEFDLAGFAVGVANKSKIIDGSKIKVGDQIIGIASSGVHSNGYSLVRKILSALKIELTAHYPELTRPIGLELLTPTKIYVNPILSLMKETEVLALAHITGGGMEGNIPRVIPQGFQIVINKDKVPVLPIFRILQNEGHVAEDEMWRVFNMGIGMVVVLSKENTKTALKLLTSMHFPSVVIGEIRQGNQNQEAEVVFE